MGAWAWNLELPRATRTRHSVRFSDAGPAPPPARTGHRDARVHEPILGGEFPNREGAVVHPRAIAAAGGPVVFNHLHDGPAVPARRWVAGPLATTADRPRDAPRVETRRRNRIVRGGGDVLAERRAAIRGREHVGVSHAVLRHHDSGVARAPPAAQSRRARVAVLRARARGRRPARKIRLARAALWPR